MRIMVMVLRVGFKVPKLSFAIVLRMLSYTTIFRIVGRQLIPSACMYFQSL